jgi:uncharacterized protein (DUF2062 family)
MTAAKPSAIFAYLQKTRVWVGLKNHILHPDVTPQQLALSFAIGCAIAFNPILGLHTWMAFLLCVIFRKLHKPLIFAATFINNPWTMVPIATVSAYLGNILLGRGLKLNLSHIRWHHLDWRNFVSRQGFDDMFFRIKPVLTPYLLGGVVLSALAFPIGYYAMLKLAERVRGMHLHLPHLHLPPFNRDKSKKETPDGHALPHEAGPGHAAETPGRPAEPESGGDGRR